MEITVKGMTCGGCVRSVTNALKTLDQNAQVDVTLETQNIKISTTKNENEVKEAIEDAGFDVILIKN